MAAAASGTSLASTLLRAASWSSPVRWATRSGRSAARSRLGYGKVANIAARTARSRSDRARQRGRDRLACFAGGRGSGILAPGPGGFDQLVVLHA